MYTWEQIADGYWQYTANLFTIYIKEMYENETNELLYVVSLNNKYLDKKPFKSLNLAKGYAEGYIYSLLLMDKSEMEKE